VFRIRTPSKGQSSITRVNPQDPETPGYKVLGSEVGLITTQDFLKHSSEDVPNRFENGIVYKRDMGDVNELVSGSPILMSNEYKHSKGITVSNQY
jgi:hypothetical protein